MNDALRKVLHIVSVGCGIGDPQVISNTRRYRRLYDNAAALEVNHPAQTAHGDLLRMGVRNAGLLLNRRLFAPDAAEIPFAAIATRYDPTVLAWIQFLGRALVQSAKNCLSKEAVQLAAQWKFATADEQRKLAGKFDDMLKGDTFGPLIRTLLGGTGGPPVIPSFLDRPTYNDYLPACYGSMSAHHPGEKKNCLLNFLLLSAFASLAGARSYMVTPLVCCDAQFDTAKAHAAAETLKVFKKWNFPLSHEREESLWAIARFQGHPSPCHFALVLELRDHRWLLLDPNLSGSGYFSSGFNIGRIAGILDETREVLPGLSLIGADPLQGERSSEALHSTSRFCEILDRSLGAILTARGKSTLEIVDVLAASELLAVLRKSNRFRNIVPADAPLRRYAVYSLLHFYLCDNGPASALGSEAHAKRYWRFMREWRPDVPDETLLSDFNGERAYETLLHICYRVAADRTSILPVFRFQKLEDGNAVHPQCQFSHTPFGAAAATISYTGLMRGEETRRMVDAELRNYWLDQFLLLYAGADLLNGHTTAELSHSLRILQALPVRLLSAESVVRGLSFLGRVA